MNANKIGCPNKTLRVPTLTVAPITHAIRAALAISATLLALGGSGAAIAQGACVFTTPTTVSCDGTFTGTVPGTFFTPVADLTLVLGDTAPTSVTPAAGLMGIDANWGGSVGVTSYADITTQGADGIFAYSATTATVNNQGSITTNVTAAGAKAMDVNAYGDVSVINNGPVNAYGTGVYDVTAVSAYSINGTVSVDNQVYGTITATAQDGNAIALAAYGDTATTVTNEGAITASSVYGIAEGIVAYAYNGNTSVTNSGSITATSTYDQAVGILASSSNGYATVTNDGSITATSGQDAAIGIEASSALGSTVNNFGSIRASSSNGNAYGILAQTADGNTLVTNSNSITAISTYAQAVGVLASSVQGAATVDNYGLIRATSPVMAIGIEASSGSPTTLNNASTVNNTGAVYTVAYGGAATGVLAQTTNGDTSVTNSGAIKATTYHGAGESLYSGPATGILATATNGNVSVANTGYIYAATSTQAPAVAAISYDTATGILVRTNHGNATVTNSLYGSINALAVAYTHDNAAAISVNTVGGNAYVSNYGVIAAVAGIGRATTIAVNAHYGSATVVNAGRIYATSSYAIDAYHVEANRDYAIGIRASGGYEDSTTVTNSGSIKATGSWWATGIEASDYFGNVSVTNTATGIITVSGGQHAVGMSTAENWYSEPGIASGIDLSTQNATFDNAGKITAVATGRCGYCRSGVYAIGIDSFLDYGQNITITNSGTISARTYEPTDSTAGTHGGALGILAVAYDAITIDNSGDITSTTAGYAPATGIHALSVYGAVTIVNSGDITSTATQVITNTASGPYAHSDTATGIYARTDEGASNISITNAGDISVSAFNARGIYTYTLSQVADVVVSNTGGITATGTKYGLGIFADVPGAGAPITVDNAGGITATGSRKARGIYVKFGSGAVDITNSGDLTAASQLMSYGVLTQEGIVPNPDGIGNSTGGALAFENMGSISASTTETPTSFPIANESVYTPHAYGVHLISANGDITANNSGTITANLNSNTYTGDYDGVAIGLFAEGANTTITNAGSITATSRFSAHTGSFGATGVFLTYGSTMGILAKALPGYGDDVTIANTGSVIADARSEYYASSGAATAANAIAVVTYGASSVPNFGDVTVTNGASGSITAIADATLGNGYAMANGIYTRVYNSGGSPAITINNAGSVSATAIIDPGAQGSATANGILAVNGAYIGSVDITNTGNIFATATTSGAATATGIAATGYSVAVALNTGSVIDATATGASGTATGLSLTNTGTAALTTNNAGMLMATFNGAGGKAYGAMITSAGDLTFTNTGHILASNATYAVGVDLISPTNVTLTNSGTITATAAAAGSIAVLTTGASNDTLTNSGTISGAIQTGSGNDTLSNAVGGIWNAVGTSDFGAGDNGITNAGTITMNNATISLGSDPTGNQFVNTGTITVLGSNTITMSTGTPVNPNPFTNNGTINFQNGAANDTLTIAGNFAGNGQLDMDVDGATSTGDLLQIHGNVVAGSVNTVNVDLLSDPTTASTTIPLVKVSGTSAAGSFVLGQFVQPKSFLGLSESLLSTPNTFSLGLTVAATTPPPTTPPPPVSIGVTVTGLSALGTLAASAAPGAQSLMNSQIGTLEDRMGAVSQTIKGGLSLWTRAFADSGTVDPGHSAGNFGQNGNFGFDQSNSGEEVGLDFAISDEFKAGALLAKAQANQSLDGNQADSSQITGNTSGLYGTWVASNGFYVDASYRWMSFHDRLHAPAGYAMLHGDADAFNLEAGKTWTLQNGLQIAPQFQYTLTKVNNINSLSGSLAGFESNGDDASRARLGVMFSKVYTPTSSNAVWMPYASLSAVEELDGKNSYSVNDDFFGETNTKGTSALAEAGVNVQLGRLAVYGGVNWQDGGALKSFFGGQVGLRYTW